MILAAGRGERMRPLTDTAQTFAQSARASFDRLAYFEFGQSRHHRDRHQSRAPRSHDRGSRVMVANWRQDPILSRRHCTRNGGWHCQGLLLLTNENEEPFLVVSGDIYVPHLTSPIA